MEFAPPTNATKSAVRPADGWISCGWLALDKWRVCEGWTFRRLSEGLGCAIGSISGWKHGGVPGVHVVPRIASLTANEAPAEAWTWWVPGVADDSRVVAEAAPESEERPVPDGKKLGTTADELRTSIRRLNALLSKEKLSPGQVAQLEGKKITALTALAKAEQAGPIELHPQYKSLVDDLAEAALEVFGAERLADLAAAFERRQATRAATERRAA